MADTQIFEPDGRAVPFADEGAGPVLVLLPERGLNIAYLGPLAHSVASADFRLVRIGRRADADASLSALAQDVVDVLDHLGIPHAWIGGHGFGGAIARTVALEHHDHTNGVLLLGVAEEDGLPALADGVPVLVVQGDADEVTPPAAGDALRAGAPGLVSVVPVAGGEHLFPATHVGATSWAIEDYLDWD